MAKFVATDYKITINGTDFSDHLAACTLDITSEEQDTTVPVLAASKMVQFS